MPIDMTVSKRSKRGFSAVGDAAAASTAAPAPAAQPDAVQANIPQVEDHPDYSHAQQMHDLGLAVQEMMKQDPETHKSVSDLMDEFMGKGVDYEAEGKRLRGVIESRSVPKRPNWVAEGVGKWLSPETGKTFEKLHEAADQAASDKQKDVEDLNTGLLKAHVEDLRAKGKTKEALMMGMISGMMSQKRTETTQEGLNARANQSAALRAELQDRALGSAEERVRLHVNSRRDIADKDRTSRDVMGLYEKLLGLTEKKVTGAVVARYTAQEAMQLAMDTILPKVKEGVGIVKNGPAPVKPGAAVVTPEPVKKGGKFAQWKAQQATGQTQ